MAITIPLDGTSGSLTESSASINSRLNWLRAGVLGANDGIVSTAAIVLGMAGATTDRWPVLMAGLIALLAGALSMAVGEYVSVSSQRDTERSLVTKQQRELAADPQGALAKLAQVYVAKGVDPELATELAEQLSATDALGAHLEATVGIDPDELTQPTHAALASFVAFVCGALVPLLGFAVLGSPWFTAGAVALALAATGMVSAKLGGAPVARAVARNVGGGVLAMAITYGLGGLVGGLG